MKFLLVAQKIIYVLDLSLMPLSEETYEKHFECVLFV
jgi:hypothetical protein